MPVPTSYTEEQLATFMHGCLGDVATELGWSVDGGSYSEAVTEALLAYDVADIADATDMRKLRALARREAWRAAVASLAARYDFTADGASHHLSQIHAAAQAALAAAEADAARYDTAYQVTATPVHYGDPYLPIEETS